MQNFTSGMVLGIAFMLGIMLNKIDRIEKAVTQALDEGLRTADIYSEGTQKVGTQAMGDAIVRALRS